MTHNLLCSDLVTVEWQCQQRGVRSVTAVLDDISPDRACLLLEHPLPAKTMVRLNCGDCRLRGNVSYCRFQDRTGFQVGVEFAEGERWSVDRYRPRYLLDPSTLPPCMASECSPTCSGPVACPHLGVTQALEDAGSTTNRVRKVAHEVARVCRNLDSSLLVTCFRNLYGDSRGEELLHEFITAYRKRVAPETDAGS